MSSQTTLNELIDERYGNTTELQVDPEINEALKPLLSRRSHRDFASRTVEEDLMQTLFACAFSSPSKSDLQQAGIIRLRDATLRKQVERLMPSMPWVANAPELLVFCGDNARIRKICEMRDRPFENDHLDSFFNATVDGALVMMSFIRAAEAAGLGCCPLSVIRNEAAALARLLELPEYVFPIAGLALGYPRARGAISARLALGATVHVDRYDDSKLSQDVDEYDGRRLRQAPIAQEKQRQQHRFGIANRYTWSEDKARQVSVNERGDFGAFVRARKFSLD